MEKDSDLANGNDNSQIEASLSTQSVDGCCPDELDPELDALLDGKLT